MDLASLAGLVLAFGAIMAAVILDGANPMSVVLPAPMILVIFGTLGAGLTGTTVRDALAAFKAVPKALNGRRPDVHATINTLVSLADRARREGMLALEEDARHIEDPFLRAGLQAAIDGTDPDDLRPLLEDRISSKKAGDRVSSKFFSDLGGYSPTIGIIGTVVALVHVLSNLSEPATLGKSIASAFVATLWGILMANVVWLPISARMRRMSDLQAADMEIALEGLMSIQGGANPRLVGERLRSMLPETEQQSAP